MDEVNMHDCNEILKQLQPDGDSSDIREAAYLAGEQKCEEAVPALAKLLETGSLGIQEAADQALRQIGGSATVKAVAPLLRSDDAPVRNLSMDIMREVGAQDMPTLVSLLHDEDPDIRIFASDILGSTKTVAAVSPLGDALLKDPEVNVRYQAAVSLGDLQHREAAPYLNKALGDEEWIQFAVIEALSKVGDSSSVSALAKAMTKSSDLVASMIVDALGEMGDVKAVAMLLKQLDASPTALRNKIVKAIVQILGGKSLTLLSESEREKFREYLLVALTDEETEIQDAAILGLGFVGGEKAAQEVLALAAGLDFEMDHERLEGAINSLINIGFTDALKAGLEGDDYKIARLSIEVMAKLEDDSVPPLFMSVFWDKERDIQRDLVTALSSTGGEGTREFFLDIADRHNDGSVLKSALAFLGAIGDDQVGEILFGFLEHPYDDVKEAALEACVEIGGDALDQRFRELFKSPDPVHRLMAIYAMGKLGIADHIEEIKIALEDEVPDIRKVALEGFTEMCVEIGEWLPLLRARLSDENREVRLTVVELMGQCPGEEVQPFLLEALQDDDDWVRVRAVEALGARQAQECIQPLVELLAEGNTLLSLKAIDALGNIDGNVAFRALLEVMNAEDPELHAAAEDALARLQEQEGGDY
jgi:HEAT repeat protein